MSKTGQASSKSQPSREPAGESGHAKVQAGAIQQSNTPDRYQALVCMMAKAARSKTVALPEPDAFDAAAHPDARLLTLCAEIEAATRVVNRFQNGDLQIKLGGSTFRDPVWKTYDTSYTAREKLVAEATALPATTLEGIQAKARAFRFLYEQVVGGKNRRTRSIIDDLVRLAPGRCAEARA